MSKTKDEILAGLRFDKLIEDGVAGGHRLQDALDYAALSGMSRKRARLELISAGADPAEVDAGLPYAYARQGKS